MPTEFARLSSSPLTDKEIADMHAIVERVSARGYTLTAERMRGVLEKRLRPDAKVLHAVIQQYRAMGCWGLAGSLEAVLRGEKEAA